MILDTTKVNYEQICALIAYMQEPGERRAKVFHENNLYYIQKVDDKITVSLFPWSTLMLFDNNIEE